MASMTSPPILDRPLYIQAPPVPNGFVAQPIAQARGHQAVAFAGCRATLARLGTRIAESIRQAREPRAGRSVTFERAA